MALSIFWTTGAWFPYILCLSDIKAREKLDVFLIYRQSSWSVVAEWSARRTRNPVVSGSSLTLATWWICSRFSRYGGHMWHQKHRPLFVFFSFNAIHFKFCNNIEFTIPKKRTLFVFQILAFLAGNDVTTFPPNFVFSIMGYLIMVSERSHHKDVKRKKKLKYTFLFKIYSVLKVQFSAMLHKVLVFLVMLLVVFFLQERFE